MASNDRIDELARKIVAGIINDDERDYDIIFAALTHVFAFWMSCVCRNCRRDVARKLKADIPAMLNSASQLAAAGKPPTCH